jgi:hypothetical protein
MKQCLKCYKTYADDTLNFCLEDGEMLVAGVVAEPPKGSYTEDAPPTIVLDQARQTNPTQWPSTPPQQSWQPAPMQQQFGGFQQLAASPSQTLAVVSLGLGVGSLTLGWCCSLGLLLGPAAMISGFIALSQIKKDPDRYTGRGLAIAGIICGSIYIAIYLLIIILWGASMFLR